MAEFSVNTHRSDLHNKFKFRVIWEGRVVASVSSVSGLRPATEPLKIRPGSGPDITGKRLRESSYDPVILERGVTHDRAFEDWAKQAFNLQGVGEASLKELRKDVRIELYNPPGQLVNAYNVFRCWVSEFRALPELDALGESQTAVERIVLQNEGWERDRDITEAVET